MTAFVGMPSVVVGPEGPAGADGADGLSAYQVAVAEGYAGTINEWILSLQGLSAYEIAVDEGFVGSINEWILSLQGGGGGAGVDSIFGETGVVTLVDYVRFNTLAAETTTVGSMCWNDEDGTINVHLKGGNVTLQIGQEQLLRVRNNTGATILNGEVVYLTGSISDRVTIAKAKADSNSTSMSTLGMLTEDIANNAEGYVTVRGLVHDLDTSAFTAGVELWVSPTTAGEVVTTRPAAPNHAVRIGWCARSHVTAGIYLIDVDVGAELQELHDVLITSVADNNLLQYSSSLGLWENVSGPVGAVVGTTDTQTLTGKTLVVASNTITTAASGNLVATNLNAALAELQGDIDTREVTSAKGAANGYAPLGADTKIAATYLPAYVDDVLEYANLAALPGTGVAGIIYVTLDTNKTYRWSGSAYTEISPSPGSTDSVTEGSTNLYFTAARVRSTVLTGLSLASSTVIAATDTVLAAFGQLQAQVTLRELLASKDATGGYAGLTAFKLNLKNAANTFTNFFTNATTAARTWTMPDKDGTVAMLDDVGGGGIGLNVLLNSAFNVNQRSYASGAAVGTLLHGHDRWRMAASGDTYTYSTSGGVTTITIPSGKVLRQTIAATNLVSDTYVLSWGGSAQGKIGAGSYGDSGITGSVTGGSNLTIEFGPGTLLEPKFEVGSTDTPYERRLYDLELLACQRYYYRAIAGEGDSPFGVGYAPGTTIATVAVMFPVVMIGVPTAFEQSGTATDYILRAGASGIVCSGVPTIGSFDSKVCRVNFSVTAGLVVGQGLFGAGNVAGSYLGFHAEIS